MNNEEHQENQATAKRPGLFWSGETLTERLETLIDPFSPARIDCAAYTLSIGPEVYVSPNDLLTQGRSPPKRFHRPVATSPKSHAWSRRHRRYSISLALAVIAGTKPPAHRILDPPVP